MGLLAPGQACSHSCSVTDAHTGEALQLYRSPSTLGQASWQFFKMSKLCLKSDSAMGLFRERGCANLTCPHALHQRHGLEPRPHCLEVSPRKPWLSTAQHLQGGSDSCLQVYGDSNKRTCLGKSKDPIMVTQVSI